MALKRSGGGRSGRSRRVAQLPERAVTSRKSGSPLPIGRLTDKSPRTASVALFNRRRQHVSCLAAVRGIAIRAHCLGLFVSFSTNGDDASTALSRPLVAGGGAGWVGVVRVAFEGVGLGCPQVS